MECTAAFLTFTTTLVVVDSGLITHEITHPTLQGETTTPCLTPFDVHFTSTTETSQPQMDQIKEIVQSLSQQRRLVRDAVDRSIKAAANISGEFGEQVRKQLGDIEFDMNGIMTSSEGLQGHSLQKVVEELQDIQVKYEGIVVKAKIVQEMSSAAVKEASQNIEDTRTTNSMMIAGLARTMSIFAKATGAFISVVRGGLGAC